jgi:hypothetical protein
VLSTDFSVSLCKRSGVVHRKAAGRASPLGILECLCTCRCLHHLPGTGLFHAPSRLWVMSGAVPPFALCSIARPPDVLLGKAIDTFFLKQLGF